MPQNFLDCDRDQSLLLPPDMREWLAEDHFAWFVIEAVEAIDLTQFFADYRNDGHGRAAHDPQMMVALTLYAYAIGERSSRMIERRCREDVAFRVIAANRTPDHATIARFRARHQEPLAALFGQVLGLCAEAGIAGTVVLAVDGTKIAADASDRQDRTYEQIAAEILAEAGAIDEAEDEIHGDARGDELPPELVTRHGRQGWISAALQRQQRERNADPEPVPPKRSERLEQCRERLTDDWQAELSANRDYEAYRARGLGRDGKPLGAPPKPHTPPAAPEGKINLTDHDSRTMKANRGYIHGYNAQAVANENQIVLAAEVITQGSDFQQLAPMIEAAEKELRTAGTEIEPGIILADAGYWQNDGIDRLRAKGMTPLVAPDADSRKDPRPGRRGGPTTSCDRCSDRTSDRLSIHRGNG